MNDARVWHSGEGLWTVDVGHDRAPINAACSMMAAPMGREATGTIGAAIHARNRDAAALKRAGSTQLAGWTRIDQTPSGL